MAPSAIRSRKRPGEKGHRCEGVVLCPGQVPALIAKFESTGTPVPLQCHPEVVWPDGDAELLGQICEDIARSSTPAMRLNSP